MTTPWRALTGAAVVAGTVAATLFAAAPASATTYDEATWYYTKSNMAANLAVANGTGVTVAVIDGSIDPSVPELSNAKISPQPSSCLLDGSSDPVVASGDATHGTNVAVMLAGNGTGNWDGRGGKGVAPGASILFYRNGTDLADGSGQDCIDAHGDHDLDAATALAIQDATAKGARVVNMSFITRGNLTATSVAMAAAERKGVVFVAGTDDKDDAPSGDRVEAPGSFNGVVLVNGSTAANGLAKNSSTSPLVTVLAPGDTLCLGGFNPATGKWDSTGTASGSSFGTAFTTGVIADAMSKWPNATSNQIVQLLVRTTGGDLHEVPSRAADGFGFGAPSLTAMLANDPSQLPDENPLLRDDATPSTADITGASASSTASSSSTAPTGATSSASAVAAGRDDGSTSWPLWLGIGVAVVVVLAVLVAVIVLRSRRRPPGVGPGASGPPVQHPAG